jgi:hypothetical protein
MIDNAIFPRARYNYAVRTIDRRIPMSVQELENAIRQLSHEEFARLAQWIDEYRADHWDRQIEADIRAGRLDEVARSADADFEVGRCTPL